MKKILADATLWIGMFFSSILIGATVYQMLVIVPEFSRDLPNGMIEFARGHVVPKAFWTSPVLSVGSLFFIGSLIFNWATPRRKWLAAAVVFSVAAEVLTVFYVWPMLRIMGLMDGNPSSDLALLSSTIKHWVVVDQLRFWLLAMPAYLFFVKALTVTFAANRVMD